MPGRGQELALTPRAAPLHGLLLAAAPGLLLAQDAPETASAPTQPSGVAEVGATLTRVSGASGTLVGGALLIDLGRWAVGGGGSILVSRRPVSEGIAGFESELGLGYGGLIVQHRPGVDARRDARAPWWSMSLLIGAGNADLRDGVLGTRLAADNFFVLQPGPVIVFPVADRAMVTLAASFRIVGGVDDLDPVGADDLGGPELTMRLRLRTGR